MPLDLHDAAIEELANADPGYLFTRDVSNAGIDRPYLYDYLVRHPEYERMERGVYVDTSRITPDNFYLLSLRKKKIIFSHVSALILTGVLKRYTQPDQMEITLPWNYNRCLLHEKEDESGNSTKRRFVEGKNVLVHTCESAMVWKDGITEGTTLFGHTVRCYRKERAICEVIRDKDEYSHTVYKEAIRSFFKTNGDAGSHPWDGKLLLIYASMFGVSDTVMDYLNILT